MPLTIQLQYGLLAGYAALLLAALLAGWRRPDMRPSSFAVGVLSASHVVYYALFLIWPDVLDGQQTMLFSIVLRYEVMFALCIALAIEARHRSWKA